MPARLVLALLCTALTSCLDPDPPGPGGIAPVQSLQDMCARYPDALAARAAVCLGGSRELWTPFFRRVFTCAELEDQVSRGQRTFNSVAATTCLTEVAVGKCEDFLRPTQACLRALAGNVDPGGACRGSEVCKDGAFCKIPGDTCGGSCVTFAAQGDSCSELECAGGLWCDGASFCRPLSGIAGPCSYDESCQPDLYCARGQCAARKDAGMLCESSECKRGLRCAGPDGAMACRAPRKLGESCVPGDRECIVGYCAAATSVCTLAAAGLACGAEGNSTNMCSFSSHCESGTCRDPLPVGATCRYPDECESFDCNSDRCQPERCP